MASFITYLADGMLAGAGISLVGSPANALTLIQAAAVFIVGTFSGLLPDLDSDSGKNPYRK
jgi:hypothetical protein